MITYKATPDEILVHGHARAGRKGEDIVCAAVSALTETIGDSLTVLCEDIHTEEGDGFYRILLPGKDPQEEILRAVFEIGMGKIERTCPEYVKRAE